MVVLAAVLRVGAQNAEAGAGDGGQRVVVREVVLTEAEEREVVVGEPAEQLAGLVDLLVAQVVGGRLGGELIGDAQRGVAHLLPVLDGLAYVGQDPEQIGADLLQVRAVGLAVHLDVDPGLGDGIVRTLRTGIRRQDLKELAGQIPSHHDLGVDHDMDAAPLAGELIGDRVDKEGHVVRDHLDDGVAALPAVLLDGRGVHPDTGRALRAVLGQPVVGEGGSEDVDRVTVGQVLRGGVQVVALEEREDRVLVGCGLVALRPGGCPVR